MLQNEQYYQNGAVYTRVNYCRFACDGASVRAEQGTKVSVATVAAADLNYANALETNFLYLLNIYNYSQNV